MILLVIVFVQDVHVLYLFETATKIFSYRIRIQFENNIFVCSSIKPNGYKKREPKTSPDQKLTMLICSVRTKCVVT